MTIFEAAFPPPTIDWLIILPVIIVTLAGIVGILIEMFRPKQNNNPIVWTCLVGLIAAAVAVCVQFGMPFAKTFGGMVVRDQFALVAQLLMILSAFLAMLFSEGYLREKRIPFGEFYPLVMWATAGGMVMVSTENLLMVFLGLETLSIPLYVLAGLARHERKSEEAAIKYFLLGAFGSAFILYGMALKYGATGSLMIADMAAAWSAGGAGQPLLLFALGMMLIGLCFKASFVPFHQWTPDVYQGSPTNVVAFMSAGSKIAAMFVLFRVLDASQVMNEFWFPVMFWIAILTMTVGNFAALVQRDVKRILAYSSISHAGYMLVGVLAHLKSPDKVGFGTTAYYLFAYTLMVVGSFAVVSLVAKSGKESTRLKDLNGLWRRDPILAVGMVVFMASLIGMPPTAGFLGKFSIISDAITADLMPLVIVLIVNSIVSCYYYLGIAAATFVNDEESGEVLRAKPNIGLGAATAISAAGIVLMTLFWTPLMEGMTGDDGGLKPTHLSRTAALHGNAPPIVE